MSRSLANLDPKSPMCPFSYPSSQTAVLLLDYLKLTMGMIPDEKRARILSQAQKLRSWAVDHDVLTIHCTIDMSRDPPPQLKMNERWGTVKEYVCKDASLGDEVEGIAAPSASAKKEVVLARRAGLFSALYSDGLVDLLEKEGIKSLVLAGVSTAVCVLSTARDGSDRGYVVTVIPEASGDPSDALHDTLCQEVLPSSVNVVGLDKWVEGWPR